MIRSFADRDAERLFHDGSVRRFVAIERIIRRKLLLLNAARKLDDLRTPPGNRLEALKRDRAGQHSIRVNDSGASVFAGSTVNRMTSKSSIIIDGGAGRWAGRAG